MRTVLLAAALLFVGGCSQLEITRYEGGAGKGEGLCIPEYDPYLLVSVAATTGESKDGENHWQDKRDGAAATESTSTKKANTTTKETAVRELYTMQIVYLPNTRVGHRFVGKSRWGTLDISVTIGEDGRLRAVNAKADSKGPETITAVTSIAGALGFGIQSVASSSGIEPGLYRMEFDSTTGMLKALHHVSFRLSSGRKEQTNGYPRPDTEGVE